VLLIKGGEVYDPINRINGETRDIYINNGRVVTATEVNSSDIEIIDASGKIIMPGGVDIHSHISGPKANAGRKLCPEDSRRLLRERGSNTSSGSGYVIPTTHLTGYLYAEMGYTTVIEAAASPIMARHTHEELQDIPIIDKGMLMTMGNNHFIMQCIKDSERQKAKDYVAWLLGRSKGYSIKIVNPGGVENWKYGKNVQELDDRVIGFDVTPRAILSTMAEISAGLNLPHPVHIHGLRLGQSGNADITTETINAMDGLNAHFCHLQFMSYGSERGKPQVSAAVKTAKAVNENKNISIDVGQIIFGPAITMTSDGPVQFNLSRKTGSKWMNDDLENESGGGIVPITYKRSNPVHSAMWITGLELFLLVDDPWRIYLTTDHPNGGPFLSYPHVIRLLMDREFRAGEFEKLKKSARENALLPDLTREYSLYEIAIITRSGPARRLGLINKGHLGEGADADITIYNKNDNPEEMFSSPALVIKNGEIVVKDGRVTGEYKGKTLYVEPGYDTSVEKDIKKHFEDAYSFSFENYGVDVSEIGRAEKVE
jgi:formylmethanofuran dehydrogenase subunit A